MGQQVQLGLMIWETGEAITVAETVVDVLPCPEDLLEQARAFGAELCRCNAVSDAAARIRRFVEGLHAEHELSAFDDELLRNEAFAAARPWLEN